MKQRELMLPKRKITTPYAQNNHERILQTRITQINPTIYCNGFIFYKRLF